jgi:hypothetical protein
MSIKQVFKDFKNLVIKNVSFIKIQKKIIFALSVQP